MYKISFCTVCKNRLHHLRCTLPRNIDDNIDFPYVEFVLLDYNSSDGLEDWVSANMKSYMEKGLLVYYRTHEPEYFHRSHSRNMAFKLATGDILCNIDADNFMGKGFAAFISETFAHNTGIFMATEVASAKGATRDAAGRICLLKQDFDHIRGYDERIDNYGFEDIDLINRLSLMGKRKFTITDPAYLEVIQHSNHERVKEEFVFRELSSLYISHLDPSSTDIIMLLKDHTFYKGTLINPNTIHSDRSPLLNDVLQKNGFMSSHELKQDAWRGGKWKRTTDGLSLSFHDNESITLTATGKTRRSLKRTDSGNLYVSVTRKDLTTFFVHFFSETNNLLLLKENKPEQINPDGFGRGIVYRNFNYSYPLTIAQ